MTDLIIMHRYALQIGISAAAVALAGCASQSVSDSQISSPTTSAYLAPAQVDRGRQEYGPGHERFPPIMTARAGYPTQNQANAALRLSRWGTVPIRTLVTKEGVETIAVPADLPDALAHRVRLFACRPGALDGVTGRVRTYRGPVVVCASDLIGADGVILARVPLNFYYWRGAWRVQDPRPGYKTVPWVENEPSPPKSSGWLPWRDRY
ncbi:conserved hypothetical protein [Hyphomicrobiales bacterium]|nr:conserved hypothetical protein [Hyphomicrobiales bacterium]